MLNYVRDFSIISNKNIYLFHKIIWIKLCSYSSAGLAEANVAIVLQQRSAL